MRSELDDMKKHADDVKRDGRATREDMDDMVARYTAHIGKVSWLGAAVAAVHPTAACAHEQEEKLIEEINDELMPAANKLLGVRRWRVVVVVVVFVCVCGPRGRGPG